MNHLHLTAHEGNMSGVMFSLELPDRLAQQMGVERPEKGFHITLMYLGKADQITPQQARQLLHAASEVVVQTPPLIGSVGDSIGSFSPGEDGTPIWASVEIDGLIEMRARLVESVIAHGFAYENQYPNFTPHMTLTFAPPGQEPVIECTAAKVQIDAIHLVYGAAARSAFTGHQPV